MSAYCKLATPRSQIPLITFDGSSLGCAHYATCKGGRYSNVWALPCKTLSHLLLCFQLHLAGKVHAYICALSHKWIIVNDN